MSNNDGSSGSSINHQQHMNDSTEDENCVDCIKQKQKSDELTKEILMIAPPHIKGAYESLTEKQQGESEKKMFSVVTTERTEEEKQRDEEERVKLEEFYKNTQKLQAPPPLPAEGIAAHISELDLEESIRKNKPSPPSSPPPPFPVGVTGVVKKPVKPLKFGSATNPEPGPQMDCED